MHLLVGAEDGVDRARWQAPGAADADVFVDLRNQQRALDAVGRIQGQRWPLQQGGERADGSRAARRTLVDCRCFREQGVGIRATAAVTTTRALRLRQQGIDVVRCDLSARQVILIPGVAPESGDSRNRPGASPLAANTMPSETPNFILRGARLATITVRRPLSACGS